MPAADRTFTAPAATDGGHIADPDLEGGGNDLSELDELRAELTAAITPTTTLPVPGRPRYAVTYRLDFTSKDLDTWRKRAKDKTFADGINGVRFAAIMLAATCTAILRDGTPLELDGTAQTFTARAFLELVGADRAAEAVVKFYGLEGNVDAAGRGVLSAAGWGDDLDEVSADPTT